MYSPLDSTYSQPSSLQKISGLWNSETTGYTEIVAPNGSFVSFSNYMGCLASGKYTIVDATKNLYTFAETVYNCDTAAFNGTKNGVATVTKSNGVSGLEKQASWGTAEIFQTSGLTLYFGH